MTKRKSAEELSASKADQKRRREERKAPAKIHVPIVQVGGTVLECPSADEMESGRTREWLWDLHVAFSALTCLEGEKGRGKSTLLAALAAEVTGGPRMDGGPGRSANEVLWLAGEEDPELDTKPKLRAAGANLSRVRFPGRSKTGKLTKKLCLPADVPLLGDALFQHSARLLVLDPWSSCLPPGVSVCDTTATRDVMEALAHLAQEHNAAVICSRNFRKDRGGSALDQGLGSSEVANVARCVIQLRPHPDQPDWSVCVVAATNGTEKPAPRGFTCDRHAGSVRINWRDRLALTADDLAEQEVSAAGRDERIDAHSLLAPILAGEWKRATDILREAAAAGVCVRSLRAAKAELRIVSKRVAEQSHCHWLWGPPAGDGTL